MIKSEMYCMGCMANKLNDTDTCPLCGWKYNEEIETPIYIKPGTQIDNYIIGRVIGHGGFGIIYIGRNIITQEIVAIKEFYQNRLMARIDTTQTMSVYKGKEEEYKKALKRFKAEAEILKNFDDFLGIVKYIDYFERNSTGYFVMEYIEGITLKEYIQQKGGRLPYEVVKRILMPVMDALGEMHRNKIVHRDISPDNIYITKNKNIKLLDFGAAREAIGTDPKSLSIILKHGFAPKEQYFTRGKQGAWTDVYALAATAYYMLTGKVPQSCLERMEEDRLVVPSKLEGKISHKEEKILMKALSIQSELRYQTMTDFQRALEEAQVSHSFLSKVKEKISITQIKLSKIKLSNISVRAKKIALLIASGLLTISICLMCIPKLLQHGKAIEQAKTTVTDDVTITPSIENNMVSISLTVKDMHLKEALLAELKVTEDELTEDIVNSIVELSLKDKEITDLSGLEIFKNLESLNLAQNNIDDISILNNFANLKHLDISQNKITNLEDLPMEIESLYASNNLIETLPNMQNYTVLKELDISNNNISDFSNIKMIEKNLNIFLSDRNVLDSDLIEVIDEDFGFDNLDEQSAILFSGAFRARSNMKSDGYVTIAGEAFSQYSQTQDIDAFSLFFAGETAQGYYIQDENVFEENIHYEQVLERKKTSEDVSITMLVDGGLVFVTNNYIYEFYYGEDGILRDEMLCLIRTPNRLNYY